MPFAAPINVDDQDEQNKNKSGGVNISGQSTTVSTGVPGQERAPSGERQKSSGQYANIQSYLDANKQQADQMGNKIADDVSSKADDATTKIHDYETKAPKVEAYDPNQAINKATSLTDQEKKTYQDTKATGGYTGPQTLEGVEGYDTANKAGTEAATAVKNAGTETGQRELLKNTYARPNYSAGENNLDQALLQGSAGSKSRLEQLGQQYSGLSSALDTANANVGNAVNSAITQAAANQKAFTPAEEAARKALLDPIQARADQANANNGAYIDRILGDAKDNVISDETLAALGLSPGQRIYNMDLSSYINQDRSQVGLDNAANAEERAKYAALASLFSDPTMSQISANGKTINPISFNSDQFSKDLAGKTAEFNNLAANTNFTGRGSSEFNGDNIDYVSSANLANYLANNGNINSSGNIRGLPGGVGSGIANSSEGQAARNQALQDLYNQINQFLDAQGYNRSIVKG